jgi:hypothetical protein
VTSSQICCSRSGGPGRHINARDAHGRQFHPELEQLGTDMGIVKQLKYGPFWRPVRSLERRDLLRRQQSDAGSYKGPVGSSTRAA